MIQRIQTVYMMIVIALMSAGLIPSLIRFYEGTKEIAYMTNWTFTEQGHISTWAPSALAILSLIVIGLTFMSVFLFRFRLRQIRLLIFTTILLVGYITLVILGTWKFSMQLHIPFDFENNIHANYSLIFPAISIILNGMAIYSIRKDEKLVRSLDRLR